jgi:lipopolysaccharide/colanic/teichoic acid biosynthesis glycosyltransferase
MTHVPEFLLKIIITGASGYVGQSIIPLLKDQCEDVLLVGRNPAQLRQDFPDLAACTTEEILTFGKGYDVLVHLAVLNNNAEGTQAEFDAVNVDLTVQTAKIAAQAGITTFYNISSVHVLDEKNSSPYAQSKRAAVRALEAVSDINVVNVYLPYVRGTQWNGKLAFLDKLPALLAKPLVSCLLAVKPSVRVTTLAELILTPDPQRDTYVLSEGQSKNLTYRIIKRGLDLLFAASVICLLWWALLIVWVLIKRGSDGPGIFAQERVGRYGKTFTCYKFRTMQQGTVQAGTHEVSEASVTPIGRFLRGTKLDELPQVWNILKNEISLIGPRPGLPVQEELFAQREKHGVFAVKPGISGLAQVNNIDMSEPEILAQWDARYIALQSLLLDVKITLATVRGGGQGDKTNKG